MSRRAWGVERGRVSLTAAVCSSAFRLGVGANWSSGVTHSMWLGERLPGFVRVHIDLGPLQLALVVDGRWRP